VKILREVTEFLLPGLLCPCCGTVTFAEPPPGLHAGAVCYGPVLNTAAVLLSCYGNVPAERSAQLIGMLLGAEVSAGWADKAAARVNAQLKAAGFDDAMTAALAAEDVLAADETPVNVLDKSPAPAPAPGEAGEAGPEEKDGKAAAGAPHVLIVRTPDGRLTFLQAPGSRRKGSVGGGIPAAFTGHLMTGGYTGCQHLLSRLSGIQQCCQHVIRRARAVMKLGPGGVQNWAGDIITVLREAHRAVEDARARGSTALGPKVLDDLRERYGTAVTAGLIHNRLRDWDTGTIPDTHSPAGCASTRNRSSCSPATSPLTGRITYPKCGAKAAKRHQVVSGYWHEWRYLDSCQYADAVVMPRSSGQPFAARVA
jgi:transposase